MASFDTSYGSGFAHDEIYEDREDDDDPYYGNLSPQNNTTMNTTIESSSYGYENTTMDDISEDDREESNDALGPLGLTPTKLMQQHRNNNNMNGPLMKRQNQSYNDSNNNKLHTYSDDEEEDEDEDDMNVFEENSSSYTTTTTGSKSKSKLSQLNTAALRQQFDSYLKIVLELPWLQIGIYTTILLVLLVPSYFTITYQKTKTKLGYSPYLLATQLELPVTTTTSSSGSVAGGSSSNIVAEEAFFTVVPNKYYHHHVADVSDENGSGDDENTTTTKILLRQQQRKQWEQYWMDQDPLFKDAWKEWSLSKKFTHGGLPKLNLIDPKSSKEYTTTTDTTKNNNKKKAQSSSNKKKTKNQKFKKLYVNNIIQVKLQQDMYELHKVIARTDPMEELHAIQQQRELKKQQEEHHKRQEKQNLMILEQQRIQAEIASHKAQLQKSKYLAQQELTELLAKQQVEEIQAEMERQKALYEKQLQEKLDEQRRQHELEAKQKEEERAQQLLKMQQEFDEKEEQRKKQAEEEKEQAQKKEREAKEQALRLEAERQLQEDEGTTDTHNNETTDDVSDDVSDDSNRAVEDSSTAIAVNKTAEVEEQQQPAWKSWLWYFWSLAVGSGTDDKVVEQEQSWLSYVWSWVKFFWRLFLGSGDDTAAAVEQQPSQSWFSFFWSLIFGGGGNSSMTPPPEPIPKKQGWFSYFWSFIFGSSSPDTGGGANTEDVATATADITAESSNASEQVIAVENVTVEDTAVSTLAGQDDAAAAVQETKPRRSWLSFFWSLIFGGSSSPTPPPAPKPQKKGWFSWFWSLIFGSSASKDEVVVEEVVVEVKRGWFLWFWSLIFGSRKSENKEVVQKVVVEQKIGWFSWFWSLIFGRRDKKSDDSSTEVVLEEQDQSVNASLPSLSADIEITEPKKRSWLSSLIFGRSKSDDLVAVTEMVKVHDHHNSSESNATSLPPATIPEEAVATEKPKRSWLSFFWPSSSPKIEKPKPPRKKTWFDFFWSLMFGSDEPEEVQQTTWFSFFWSLIFGGGGGSSDDEHAIDEWSAINDTLLSGNVSSLEQLQERRRRLMQQKKKKKTWFQSFWSLAFGSNDVDEDDDYGDDEHLLMLQANSSSLEGSGSKKNMGSKLLDKAKGKAGELLKSKLKAPKKIQLTDLQQAQTKVLELWNPLMPGVYSCANFIQSNEAIHKLRKHLDGAAVAGIPTRKPIINAHGVIHKHGIILDDDMHGAVSYPEWNVFQRELIDNYIRPLGRILFRDYIRDGDDDESYAFTITYKGEADDDDEDISMENKVGVDTDADDSASNVALSEDHTDASVLTLNINLNLPTDYERSRKRRNDDDYKGLSSTMYFIDDQGERRFVQIEPGMALLYRGMHVHGIVPHTRSDDDTTINRDRHHLIVWLFGHDGYIRKSKYEDDLVDEVQEPPPFILQDSVVQSAAARATGSDAELSAEAALKAKEAADILQKEFGVESDKMDGTMTEDDDSSHVVTLARNETTTVDMGSAVTGETENELPLDNTDSVNITMDQSLVELEFDGDGSEDGDIIELDAIPLIKEEIDEIEYLAELAENLEGADEIDDAIVEKYLAELAENLEGTDKIDDAIVEKYLAELAENLDGTDKIDDAIVEKYLAELANEIDGDEFDLGADTLIEDEVFDDETAADSEIDDEGTENEEDGFLPGNDDDELVDLDG